jgi:hypothetical protein
MAENAFNITIDNTLVGQQYLDTFRRSEHFEPEKSLLAAILEDAVQEYRKYSRAHDPIGKSRFREVEEWFMGRDNEWVFSFENVCELLGLDPEYVRGRVREAQGRSAEEKPALHSDRTRRRAA